MAAAAMNAMTRKRGGDVWQPCDFFPSLKDETAELTNGRGMAAQFREQIAAYKGPTAVGRKRK